MKCSIITINYNNAVGLEKTIQSVVAQSLYNVEYIVIDGGSTDGSREVIRKYEKGITYWVNEKDSGIYNAMNKGIARATGDYLLFLNSGDYFYDKNILSTFWKHENAIVGTDILFGDLLLKEEKASRIYIHPERLSFNYFLKGYTITHPTSFIRRSLFQRLGGYNEENRIISDWEFFVRAVCVENCTYRHVPVTLSVFIEDGISSDPKNIAIIQREKARVYQKYFQAFMPDYERLAKLDDIFFYSRILNIIKRFSGKKWHVKFTEIGTFKTPEN